MPENKTDLVVQAHAKGFQELQQQAAKLVESAAKASQTQSQGFAKIEKGGRAYRKEIQGLDKDLKALTKTQLAVTKALLSVDKGSTLFKQLKENLKNVNTEANRLSSVKEKLQTLFGPKDQRTGKPLTPEDMARGGFVQGLVQGSTGIQLQRGPGMWRQAAGMALGGMARGFAAAPFGGVQGVQQGLAGIPVVGGFLAGQFGNAMGYGEGALEVQRTRLGAMPLFGGGGGGLQRIKQARARGEASVKAPGQFMSQEFIAGEAEKARRAAMAGTAVTPEMRSEIEANTQEFVRSQIRGRVAKSMATVNPAATESQRKTLERLYTHSEETNERYTGALAKKGRKIWEDTLYRDQERRRGDEAAQETRRMLNEPEEKYKSQRAAAGAAAAAKERRRPFEDVRRLGQRLGGLSEAEAIQAMTPMLQAAGGGIEEAKRQQMIPTAFAAQTVYGVGAETSGAFLGAGRRGGLVGAEGRAGEAQVEAIGDALSMGLEGSEIPDYLQAIAAGIESFKTTGMPINSRSIANIGGAFANLGMGGVRGAEMGKRFGAAAQRMTQTGPQDAIDLMMLQTVGGYKGGGMEQYMEAMKKMESLGGEGGIGTPEAQEMIKKLYTAGGGGATGTWVMREAFGRKGMQMGVAEAELVAKSAMAPETLTEEERGRITKINEQMMAGQERAPTGVAGLTRQADEMMAAYGGAIKRAAALQNKQNSIGEALLPTLQGLQASSANITKAFQILSDDGLNKATKMIEKFTANIEKIAKMFDEGQSGWTLWSKIATGAF